jgi:hypothetical protein
MTERPFGQAGARALYSQEANRTLALPLPDVARDSR